MWRITMYLRILLVLPVLVLAACATAGQPAIPNSASPLLTATPTPSTRGMNTKEVILATTTSTQDSGLLDVLVPLFMQKTGYQIKVISVGTGAALALGARGEADVVLVHAPEAEIAWMAAGNGMNRILVMHNDFVLTGPQSDPAKVRTQKDAIGALRSIAAAKAAWVSRDDKSGTDQLEKALWKQAGIDPAGQAWYIVSGQGMGATLTLADQKNGYTLSDRATYLARKNTLQLQILLEGDKQLLNIYHVMPVNPAKFPGVAINEAGGKAFADFLVAPDTQQVIANFGKEKYGQPLFYADAGKAEDQLGR